MLQSNARKIEYLIHFRVASALPLGTLLGSSFTASGAMRFAIWPSVTPSPRTLQTSSIADAENGGGTVADAVMPVWVPIIHPCWSRAMSVFVEGAAESVPSADVEVRDPLRIGNRFG